MLLPHCIAVFWGFSDEVFMISVGIDLGTTNSVLAFTNLKPNGDIVSKVMEINRPVSMYSAVGNAQKLTTEKKSTLPSCIYYVQENNYRPLVGDFAKMQYPIRPHLVAKSIKSQMGKPLAEGLSPDIPDKTPSQISSRILKHMISEAEKALRTKITDAIITVPANFDSSMCQATREAARQAGIQVTNPDGTEKPILLSEPNAVIYDLFNQIRNGEIPDTVLDLSQTRRVIVFDLGGGTLDITMHEIKRRNEKNDGTLKVSEIATNRYTLLGGDDFDEVISEVMFQHYLSQYSGQQNVILKHKSEVMPNLRRFAEDLKIEMSNSFSDSDSQEQEWWEDDSDSFSTGGLIGSTGFAYDDEFTREQVEEILSVFMADELKFDDYKRIGQITNTRNIIFPILDVLDKASKKLETPDVKVDAVIVNGGMSKFYMVTRRLTQFFGFEPIVVLDPDLAVARGAAVYHYLLTNASHTELADDMISVGAEPIENPAPPTTRAFQPTGSHIGIEFSNAILNDALYLGTKNNTRMEIIPTGAELPFNSAVHECLLPTSKTGTKTSQMVLPIQSKNLDGTFRIIAKSIISFSSSYPAGTKVAFRIYMDVSKTITMEAWICLENSDLKIDSVKANIVIDNDLTPEQKRINKVVAPNGSRVNPKEILDSFIKNCRAFEKMTTPSSKRKKIAEDLRMDKDALCSACNRSEFAPVIIKALNDASDCEEAKMRLYTISRKILPDWTEKEKKEIAKLCMSQLGGALNGFFDRKKVNSNIQAIYTLALCGTPQQLKQLERLHEKPEYLQACIYAHAVSKTCVEWIIERFERSVKSVHDGKKDDLQNTAYFLGVALNDNLSTSITSHQIKRIIDKIVSVIEDYYLSLNSLISCIFALGWICDQKNQEKWGIDYKTIQKVKDVLDRMDTLYDTYETRTQRAKDVVYKLVEGKTLTKEEEELLLEQINQ